MKKSFAIIALAALVMLAGCKKNDPKPNGTRLIAGIEKHKSDSKTSLDGTIIKWSESDKLYVNNGTTPATFTLVSGAGTTTGEFATTGEYTFAAENNVAVYPNNYVSGLDNTTVTMTLPAVQAASGAGSFGNGANPMMGTFSDMDNLTLTSLCGVLCLQLTGNNVAITAIEIVGGPDDKLNGTFTANYKDTDPVLAKSGDDGNNTVRLNCPATLTSTAQKFYVVLPAGTLANGFTMKVYNGTNVIFTKSTTHDITMHLNTIETMDPLHIELWDGNLSTLTGSEPAGYATATNDMTIYGTLAATANNVKVSIADGANVTLQDATINGQGFSSYDYAGLNLLGSANITLVGTSTMSGGVEKAGIYVPENKTLTISGDGTINATGGQYAAGIGSNYQDSSGNIVITNGSATINATGGYAGAGIGSGYKAASECGNIEITDSFTGTVNATGHYGSPGIGSGNRSSCGSITISGGTINATGEDGGAVGNGAPGIGSGIDGSCGAITINESVTLVTAVKGNSAPCCIGKGSSASCGTINIGGTEYPSGATPNQTDGLTFVYPAPPTAPEGAINGKFTINANGDQVYFSKGNLQYIGSAATPYWKFADHQWEYLGNNGQNSTSQTVDRDLFGWATSGYNHNNHSYQPWETNETQANYYAYNNQALNLWQENRQAEWGYNAISNGGNQENIGWHTLIPARWEYLFYTRTTSSGIRYAKAQVNGVNGMIMLPDDWNTSYYTLNSTNTANAKYNTNVISLENWNNVLEPHGAVFLPDAGIRVGTTISTAISCYWTSDQFYSYQNKDQCCNLWMHNTGFSFATMERYKGASVRLVIDAN